MIATFAILLVGFSIVSALLLIPASLGTHSVPGQGAISRVSGVVLLLGLTVIQGMHGLEILGRPSAIGSTTYVAMLYLVAPAFYLLIGGALQLPGTVRRWNLLAFAPVAVMPWLDPRWAIPLSFLLGAVFAIHLGVLVHRLREQRGRFRLELAGLGLHAVLAIAILGLGLASPWIGMRGFVLGYAIAIGLGFALSVHLLLRYPDLVGKAADAVATTYSVSTLARVDRDEALARLQDLMGDAQVYADENLKLASLAARLELSPHQLSELVNTQFGIGFSRYVRERRVAAACSMLIAEPRASVLSVGLAVGFTSQSNFYAAFREITGEVPGHYRRDRLHNS